MYEISIEEEFAGAHFLKNYKGKCEKLHGHNWKVVITISGETLGKDGLLIDFKIIRDKLKKILEKLDHNYLNNIPFFKKINPSSENIAFYIFQKLKVSIKDFPVKIKKVTVWENNKQSASYIENKQEKN